MEKSWLEIIEGKPRKKRTLGTTNKQILYRRAKGKCDACKKKIMMKCKWDTEERILKVVQQP